VVDVIDEESCQQDQDEDTTHTFQGAYLNVFGIQTVFLIEAIGMFDLRAKAPLGIYGLSMAGCVNGDIGDQDHLAVQVWIVGDQHPEDLLRLGQSDLEPSQLDVHGPRFASVSESRLQGEGERDGSGQIVQQLRFPAIQTLVVDLHLAIVPGLLGVLCNGDTRVSIAAAEALGQIADGTAVPGLNEALDSKYPSICEAAARALGRIGGDIAISALRDALLKDQDSQVCQTIIEALKSIGTSEARDAFHQWQRIQTIRGRPAV
jgi:hypothetical protein